MGYVKVGIQRQSRKPTLLAFVSDSAVQREKLLAELNDLSAKNVLHIAVQVIILPGNVLLLALPPGGEMELLVQTILAQLITHGSPMYERQTMSEEDFQKFYQALRAWRRGILQSRSN